MTHHEYRKKQGKDCRAWDMNYGGNCLKCGYDPEKHGGNTGVKCFVIDPTRPETIESFLKDTRGEL